MIGYNHKLTQYAHSQYPGMAVTVIKNPIKITERMTDSPASPLALSSFGEASAVLGKEAEGKL